MSQESVLVVDDDPAFLSLIRITLSEFGYRVETAFSGRHAIECVRRRAPDVVLLDLRMKEMGGAETCRELRKWSNVLVVCVSCSAHFPAVHEAMLAGADCWLQKKGDGTEVAGFLRDLLARRAGKAPLRELICAGALRIDGTRRVATCGGSPLPLTGTEFTVLWELAAYHGQVVSDEKILHAACGKGPHLGGTLHTHVHNLRVKLKAAGLPEDTIVRLRGAGYCFRSPESCEEEGAEST